MVLASLVYFSCGLEYDIDRPSMDQVTLKAIPKTSFVCETLFWKGDQNILILLGRKHMPWEMALDQILAQLLTFATD